MSKQSKSILDRLNKEDLEKLAIADMSTPNWIHFDHFFNIKDEDLVRVIPMPGEKKGAWCVQLRLSKNEEVQMPSMVLWTTASSEKEAIARGANIFREYVHKLFQHWLSCEPDILFDLKLGEE
jgi:hypothetical protein